MGDPSERVPREAGKDQKEVGREVGDFKGRFAEKRRR